LLFQFQHRVVRWPIDQTDFGYIAKFSQLANVCQQTTIPPNIYNN